MAKEQNRQNIYLLKNKPEKHIIEWFHTTANQTAASDQTQFCCNKNCERAFTLVNPVD